MEDDEEGDDVLDADGLADAGDVVGYSAAWVSDRIAEYRDGEHGGSVNEIEA